MTPANLNHDPDHNRITLSGDLTVKTARRFTRANNLRLAASNSCRWLVNSSSRVCTVFSIRSAGPSCDSAGAAGGVVIIKMDISRPKPITRALPFLAFIGVAFISIVFIETPPG